MLRTACLLNRSDLPAAEREHAQHELAQDFLKAGMLDRAESGFEQLKDTRYALPALRSLIRIFESEHDWPRAIEAVKTLQGLVDEPVPQIVHYYCEQAQSALASKPADIEGLKYVTERVHTPVMADESVFGPAQVFDLIERRAADIINIKLMKTGGLSNAIRIADIASIYGVQCMIGCMIESAISVAAAVHLAVAKADTITKVDLDGPSLGQFNPVEGGVIFNESEITITEAPGLGIREIRGLEMLPG